MSEYALVMIINKPAVRRNKERANGVEEVIKNQIMTNLPILDGSSAR